MRLAFLGTGSATFAHSRVLASLAGDAVERVYASRAAERARRTCLDLGGAGALGAYDQAIADARVDAVVVTTPPADHLRLTLAALAAGKHVVVEKPAFLRSQDVARVRAAAGDAGRKVLVAENYPYKPLTRRLRTLIDEGAVGDPRLVCVNAVKHQEAGGWRATAAGGGALLEGGIHWISLLTSLGMDVDDAAGFRSGAHAGADRTAACVLSYRNGAIGTLTYSWDVRSPLRGARLSHVYGTRGTITFESNGAFVRVSGSPAIIIPDPRDASGRRAMWRDFLRALHGDTAPAYGLADAERDQRIVEAATPKTPA